MLRRVARRIAGPLLILVVAGLPVTGVFSCSPSPPHSGVAGACAINSDCNSPLSCAFGRCHNACKESRDCPTGERCESAGGGMGVCALPQEFTCSAASTCKQPGLVCASDQQCRTPCQTTTDCSMTGVKGLCVPMQAPGSGACFDPSEIDGGVPDAAEDDASDAEGGTSNSGSDDGGGNVTATDGAQDAADGSRDATVVGDGGGVADGGGVGEGAGGLDDGAAEAACPASLTSCNNFCVDPMTDKNNCNGCGHKCLVKCLAGKCADPIALSTYYAHTCALLSDGTVACWGDNTSGQLGTGGTSNALAPVAASGLSGVKAVVAGYQHSCALLSDGTVWCFGSNTGGELGNGMSQPSSVPVEVLRRGAGDAGGDAGVSNAVAIGVGGLAYSNSAHSCAVLADGTAVCWGDNYAGNLGTGTSNSSLYAVTVSGLSGANAVIAGSLSSCALVSPGIVKCWGQDNTGQNSLTAVSVPGLSGGVVGIAGGGEGGPSCCGRDHACVLLSDGTVKCWGANGHGQLGSGTTTDSSTAVTVLGLSGAKAIAAGGAHSCAVVSDGTVQCWGDNSKGQLGTMPDGGAGVDAGLPESVSGLTGATAVVAGAYHSCVLLSDHSVKCWGSNAQGQLGDGTGKDSTTPVTVAW
jgi:Regulator of chromosome condensation (RCC1) repeat